MEFQGHIFLPILVSLGGYVLYLTVKRVYDELTSPMRALRGPPNPSLIFGNVKVLDKAESSTLQEKWVEEYGHTITYKMMFSEDHLYTVDTKALNHILMHNYIYQRPAPSRYTLAAVAGNGLLVSEADVHKQQRRIMNPAFGPAQIRELTEVFIEKSLRLRDVLSIETSKEETKGRVEILSWLGKMTLDVIGQAGFNYEFDALSGKVNALNEAFKTIFGSATGISIPFLLKGMFPILRFLPERKDQKLKEAQQTMNGIGSQLLQESKAEVGDNKESFTRRDLLSLLIRANTAEGLAPTQRMSDSAVLAQVPTFLVAGHETTSTATTWALFALSQNLRAQTTLREEVSNFGSDYPTMDELNSLPYLDAVVRETLRVHSPVTFVGRQAVQDDFLPFGHPLMDRNGKMTDGIHVKKGQIITIPIQALNRAKNIWGEDSFEFKPERWEKTPQTATSIPGVWGNMLTFLGGPRACIGYRFSLVEMKALLFTLIRAFEFELAVPASDVGAKTFIVQRPFMKSNLKAGNQLPLILKPVSQF